MDVAFGDTWKQFKGLNFATPAAQGFSPNVFQAVGVYADDKAARAVFDRLVSNLRQCAARHAPTYEFSVQQQDPSTVALCYEQCDTLYRVKDSVVIEVEAAYFADSAKIASTVLQTITARIPDA